MANQAGGCSTADSGGDARLPEGRVLKVALAQCAAATAHGSAGDLEGAHGIGVLEHGEVLGELGQCSLGLSLQRSVGGGSHDGRRGGGDLHGGVRGSHE